MESHDPIAVPIQPSPRDVWPFISAFERCQAFLAIGRENMFDLARTIDFWDRNAMVSHDIIGPKTNKRACLFTPLHWRGVETVQDAIINIYIFQNLRTIEEQRIEKKKAKGFNKTLKVLLRANIHVLNGVQLRPLSLSANPARLYVDGHSSNKIASDMPTKHTSLQSFDAQFENMFMRNRPLNTLREEHLYNRSFFLCDTGNKRFAQLLEGLMYHRQEWHVFHNPEEHNIPPRIRKRADEFFSPQALAHFDSNRSWALDALHKKFFLSDYEVMHGTNDESNPLQHEVLRGRASHSDVSVETSLAMNGRFSVQLRVRIPDHISRVVEEKIDSNIVPREGDTVETLAARISESEQLDEMAPFYPLGYLVRQNNATTWKQAKRRSESVIVEPPHIYNGTDGEGKGREVMSLFVYPSHERHPDDWRDRPMSVSTFALLVHIWMSCWPFLTVQSRRCPPNHVERMHYFVLMMLQIGHHRDNFCVKDISSLMDGMKLRETQNSTHGTKTSQQWGTNVILYTTGTTPQTFTFRFPHKNKMESSSKEYHATPIHQFSCGNGTVSILDPIDDLLMTHSAKFEKGLRRSDPTGYRICWSMRWLSGVRDFYTDTCGMRLDSECLRVLKKRKTWERSDDNFQEHIRNIWT